MRKQPAIVATSRRIMRRNISAAYFEIWASCRKFFHAAFSYQTFFTFAWNISWAFYLYEVIITWQLFNWKLFLQIIKQ